MEMLNRKKITILRKDQNKRRFLKEVTVSKMLPNILTIGALCTGLSAVRFALNDRWEIAVVCILIAALLDGTDGRVARFLGSTSQFGAELDSLSDFVSFGITPALIMYFRSLNKFNELGWAMCLFFSVCCGLRLARFNTTRETKPSWAYNFFTGVPAPAGAIICLLPMMLSFELKQDFFINPFFCSFIVVFTGLLMVSRLPTFAFKKVRIPHKWILPVLILTSLSVICLITEIWVTISTFIIAYLLSIPYSVYVYKKLERTSI